MHFFARKFIARYKRFLINANVIPKSGLQDLAYEGEDEIWKQWSDDELASLRNFHKVWGPKKASFVERDLAHLRWPMRLFSGHFNADYKAFGTHLNPDFPSTIFAYNPSLPNGRLLLLADIDNKDGTGDPDRAAGHLQASYGLDSCFVEPSTHLMGRHVYILLDTTITGAEMGINRDDIWATFEKFTQVIQQDTIWKKCGVKFDGFFGLPTLWEQDADGWYSVQQRSKALKLPRCLQGETDLKVLENLRPVSLERLQDCLRKLILPPQAVLGMTIQNRIEKEASVNAVGGTHTTPSSCSGYDISQMNGLEKKKACISKLLIATDCHVSFEEVYADYMANWQPSTLNDTRRDEKKRESVIRSLLKKMKKGYRQRSDQRKYPFKRNQFTKIIEDLKIDPMDFKWDRRERIDIQRLSDFVGMKIADAFYKGKDGWFGMTKRDTTVANSRKLKAKWLISKGKDRGGIDWTLNNSTYKKLLEIAKKYHLLEVVEDYQMPVRDGRTHRKLADGTARLIGPGTALKAVRDEWMPIYKKWKASAATTILRIA